MDVVYLYLLVCLDAEVEGRQAFLELWDSDHPKASLASLTGMVGSIQVSSTGWQQGRWTQSWRDTALLI